MRMDQKQSVHLVKKAALNPNALLVGLLVGWFRCKEQRARLLGMLLARRLQCHLKLRYQRLAGKFSFGLQKEGEGDRVGVNGQLGIFREILVVWCGVEERKRGEW